MSTDTVRYFYRTETTGAGDERRVTIDDVHTKVIGEESVVGSVFR